MKRFALIFLLVFTLMVWLGTRIKRPDISANRHSAQMPPPNMAAITPGINDFALVPAVDAKLRDSEEVIGVVVENLPRAYRVAALGGAPDRHVVNDIVAEKRISVTYCDMNDTARVLTYDGDAPIKLGVAGWSNGRLMLWLDQRGYDQESSGIPLADYPFVRTTWGAWRKDHPDTDVYLGGGKSQREERSPSPNVGLSSSNDPGAGAQSQQD